MFLAHRTHQDDENINKGRTEKIETTWDTRTTLEREYFKRLENLADTDDTEKQCVLVEEYRTPAS